MRHALVPIALGVALSVAAGVANASTSLNIDLPIWTFASYDLAGHPIPNQISHSYPFGTPTADNGSIPYWTATTTFAQPAPGEVLDLVNVRPDDRAVFLLNGVEVAAFGGLGPGLSQFVFTPGGPEVPQFFLNNCCEGSDLNDIVFGPFVPGVNTLEIIVNNTNHGRFGPIVDFGPSRMSFSGFVGVPGGGGGGGSSGTPEPGVWATMLMGFVALGVVLRRRRAPSAY